MPISKNSGTLLIFLFLVALVFAFFKFGNKEQKHVKAVIGNYDRIKLSQHARCRMDCRDIDTSEISDVLRHGVINESKTRVSEKGTSYAVEGVTKNGEHLRIVCSPHDQELVIVTVIDTDKEWACDCK